MNFLENPTLSLSISNNSNELLPITGKSNTVDLSEMTTEQQAEFKSSIDKSRGRARILVHPFFIFLKKILDRYDDGTRTTNYFNGIMRVIKKRTPESTPLIIMEEKQRMSDTSHFIDSLPQDYEPVYLIATEKATCTPYHDGFIPYTKPHPQWVEEHISEPALTHPITYQPNTNPW
ncbi:hypothetical protein A3D77_06305 [Candidatus Gottesmanbacteria bacterium RIFCSPHIGHO2_02_FULL_39_11]|uniref:Uncharacterized protein n=1 Tax=Candidatus Gottesmanbacteria bacterium RIFCSPHIGHO2_02_FULL_39_11 TaxID=1798382 RepID=A0A1F5ZVZ6_9BACT|nr:MAG: hypothetical protein A3D77_06305 [Candidatus Gottesmanbacteria bacterium RIFCSPHIGHO2_02_FULL_39_11]